MEKGKMTSNYSRVFATFTVGVIAVVLIAALGITPAGAVGPSVVSQVAEYYSFGSPGLRSATPMSVSQGGGTASQTANLDSTVTVAISGVSGYGDSGFGVDAGLLGNLNGVLVHSTGDHIGFNLWFNVDGGEYFTWSGDTFTAVGGDAYILGPGSTAGVTEVKDSTLFTSMTPGGASYTLAQLKAGAASGIGITGTTPVRLWMGVCCDGTQSATIESLYVSSGTITDFYVDSTYTDGSADGHIFGVDAFSVIQDAINAAGSGATIHVAAGTYVEQLSITKSLTLTGANQATTIVQSPDVLSACFSTKKPIICVNGADTNINTLTVNGAGKGNVNSQFVGIAYYNAGGTVDHTTLTHVRDTPLSGVGSGVALYNYNADSTPRIFTVTNNTMLDYQKNGMALSGTNLTVGVSGNTVTGGGPMTTIAQNGIQVSYGAGGVISGNTVSANVWTGRYDSSTNDPMTALDADGGAGVLLYAPGASVEVGTNTLTGNQFGVWSVAATSVNIHNNSITGLAHTGYAFPTGIAVWSDDQWGSGEVGTVASVSNNTLEGNDYGLLVRDYLPAAPAPSASGSGNTFTSNNVQVASSAGTLSIATMLSGNTYDRAVTVDHGGSLLPFIWSHIQDGVNAGVSGDTVNVAAGTYVENITVPTPLTLAGANEATTIIEPAVSDPNCGSSGPTNAGGSLCPGGSNIILVQANNVTVHHFTLDGDNPGQTSAYNFGGANLDARNGIITNHLAGMFNGLEVHHVTVRNIFLRGLYASSGGTFSFHDDTVTNVRAVYESIAMFAYGGGPGLMQNNTVSYANDAISANHSSGIQFLNNTVTHSGSGVHTDNAGDGGGLADLIQGNKISDCDTAAGGYGIFVFVPYIAPTVNNNTVTNCQYGLLASGQGAAVTALFTNNTVNGPAKAAGSVGVTLTTEEFGFGFNDVTASFTGNVITNNETGVLLTAEAAPHTVNATFHCDQIAGNTKGVDKGTAGTYTNDFTHTWWGSGFGPTAASNPAGFGDSVVAGINYDPWAMAPDCSPAPWAVTVHVAGDLKGTYDLDHGQAQRVNYAGLDNGPVMIHAASGVPITAAMRDSWWDGSKWTSYAQMMGLPSSVLSDTYVFPAYNDVTLDEQLRFGNVDSVDTTVTVTIGGVLKGSYLLHPSASLRETYAGVDGGPVVVQGTPGVKIIAAIRDSWWDGSAWSSYSQLMGLPSNQASDKYTFPSYNNVTLDEQLRIGNVDLVDSTVTVTIGGVLQGSYLLHSNQSVRVNYAGLDSGPVVVEGTPGVKIIAALRDSWWDGSKWTSYAQVMGLPSGQLSDTYVFPAYNNVSLDEQLRFGNVGSGDTTVTVTIGGIQRGSYLLHPNEQQRVNYAGLDSGPVVLHSSGGVLIIAAERDSWWDGSTWTSYAQMMGLPPKLATDTYMFPAYNTVSLDEQLRFGVP
jgi:nitrous oxidase accessory protein NosD